jgi:hypothetical protein
VEKSRCIQNEDKVKTNHNRRRGTPFVSGGLVLALLLSGLPDISAEERATDGPSIKPKEEKIKRNQAMEPDITDGIFPLVGPSGEEIHDFLYPTPRDGQVVRPAN